MNYRKNIFKGITKNILILGLVSLFTDLSSQMVFPLIPLFLTTEIGAGAFYVGIVEGFAETIASLFKVISGFWSDRIRKRKIFVLFGYSLSSFTKPIFALANTWGFVLAIRMIERIGKGLRDAPRDAIIAESTNENNRGIAYGFHRAMDGLGSALGAIFAFILLPFLGYRHLFAITIIPGILAILAILFVKERKTVKTKNDVISIKVSFHQLSKNLKLFIIISSIFTLGNFGYAFLLLRGKILGLSDQTVILLYIIFYLIYVISSIFMGILSDKIGRRKILLMGYFLFILISTTLIFISNKYELLFIFIVYGIFYSMIDGSQRAFVVDLAPKDIKATALGSFYTAIGLMALPGGMIAGLLWDKISLQATFIYSTILGVLAFVLFTFEVKPYHKNNNGPKINDI